MGRVSRALASVVDFIPADASGNIIDSGIGGRAGTGELIGPETALNVSAFWRGLRLISDSLAMLPLKVYRELDGGGKTVAKDHHLYRVLHRRPNPEMTSFTWRQTMAHHVVAWGNGFSEITRDGMGRVAELWPLRPDRMRVERHPTTREIRYRYTLRGGEERILSRRQVHHIRGLGFDGLVGYPVLTLMRETIGLVRAAEKVTASTFKNGARPGVVLSHPGKLSEPAKQNLGDSWDEHHAGLDNAERTAVLDEGVKVFTVGFPPADAQFLQTREFQVTEFARWIGLPPHKLYDLKRATFSNIEQQAFEYLTDSLNPWLVNWEQQQLLDCFEDDDDAYSQFERNALMQVDARSRALFYHTMRWLGVFNANDIASREELNPLPDGLGDIYMVPLNMGRLDDVQPGTDRGARRAALGALATGGTDPALMTQLVDIADRLEAIETSGNGRHAETEA